MEKWWRRRPESADDNDEGVNRPQGNDTPTYDEEGAPLLQAFSRQDKEDGLPLGPPSPLSDSGYPAGYLHNPEDK